MNGRICKNKDKLNISDKDGRLLDNRLVQLVDLVLSFFTFLRKFRFVDIKCK